jgi:hypothetical protein
VITGTFIKLKVNFKSFVLAESWPSWAFTLSDIGASEITTFCQGLSLKTRHLLVKTGIGKTLVHKFEFLRQLEAARTTKAHIWIQGSSRFIEDIYKWLDPRWSHRVTVACSDPIRKTTALSKSSPNWNLH